MAAKERRDAKEGDLTADGRGWEGDLTGANGGN